MKDLKPEADETPKGKEDGFVAANNGNFSWWGTFAKDFFTKFSLKSARLQGETFSQCVGRTQDAFLSRPGSVALGAVSGVSLLVAPGTTSLGSRWTWEKVGEVGKTVFTKWKNLPKAPILDVAPWVSKAVGITTGAALGLEFGFAVACR